jgi:hypothetical protein
MFASSTQAVVPDPLPDYVTALDSGLSIVAETYVLKTKLGNQQVCELKFILIIFFIVILSEVLPVNWKYPVVFALGVMHTTVKMVIESSNNDDNPSP